MIGAALLAEILFGLGVWGSGTSDDGAGVQSTPAFRR